MFFQKTKTKIYNTHCKSNKSSNRLSNTCLIDFPECPRICGHPWTLCVISNCGAQLELRDLSSPRIKGLGQQQTTHNLQASSGTLASWAVWRPQGPDSNASNANAIPVALGVGIWNSCVRDVQLRLAPKRLSQLPDFSSGTALVGACSAPLFLSTCSFNFGLEDELVTQPSASLAHNAGKARRLALSVGLGWVKSTNGFRAARF